METASLIRQKYLEAAVVECRKHFADCGYELPREGFRISVGFPRGSHGGKKAIGQCWPVRASTDQHCEMFISPELRVSKQVLETIMHELIHFLDGCKSGHKGLFRTVALAIGFVAPMTSTPAGEAMKAACEKIIKKLGEYPAGALMTGDRKKQGTRLLKCACECGYTVRTTRFWIEKAGPPICPADEISMKCETVDDEEG